MGIALLLEVNTLHPGIIIVLQFPFKISANRISTNIPRISLRNPKLNTILAKSRLCPYHHCQLLNCFQNFNRVLQLRNKLCPNEIQQAFDLRWVSGRYRKLRKRSVYIQWAMTIDFYLEMHNTINRSMHSKHTLTPVVAVGCRQQ